MIVCGAWKYGLTVPTTLMISSHSPRLSSHSPRHLSTKQPIAPEQTNHQTIQNEINERNLKRLKIDKWRQFASCKLFLAWSEKRTVKWATIPFHQFCFLLARVPSYSYFEEKIMAVNHITMPRIFFIIHKENNTKILHAHFLPI